MIHSNSHPMLVASIILVVFLSGAPVDAFQLRIRGRALSKIPRFSQNYNNNPYEPPRSNQDWGAPPPQGWASGNGYDDGYGIPPPNGGYRAKGARDEDQSWSRGGGPDQQDYVRASAPMPPSQQQIRSPSAPPRSPAQSRYPQQEDWQDWGPPPMSQQPYDNFNEWGYDEDPMMYDDPSFYDDSPEFGAPWGPSDGFGPPQRGRREPRFSKEDILATGKQRPVVLGNAAKPDSKPEKLGESRSPTVMGENYYESQKYSSINDMNEPVVDPRYAQRQSQQVPERRTGDRRDFYEDSEYSRRDRQRFDDDRRNDPRAQAEVARRGSAPRESADQRRESYDYYDERSESDPRRGPPRERRADSDRKGYGYYDQEDYYGRDDREYDPRDSKYDRSREFDQDPGRNGNPRNDQRDRFDRREDYRDPQDFPPSRRDDFPGRQEFERMGERDPVGFPGGPQGDFYSRDPPRPPETNVQSSTPPRQPVDFGDDRRQPFDYYDRSGAYDRGNDYSPPRAPPPPPPQTNVQSPTPPRDTVDFTQGTARPSKFSDRSYYRQDQSFDGPREPPTPPKINMVSSSTPRMSVDVDGKFPFGSPEQERQAAFSTMPRGISTTRTAPIEPEASFRQTRDKPSWQTSQYDEAQSRLRSPSPAPMNTGPRPPPPPPKLNVMSSAPPREPVDIDGRRSFGDSGSRRAPSVTASSESAQRRLAQNPLSSMNVDRPSPSWNDVSGINTQSQPRSTSNLRSTQAQSSGSPFMTTPGTPSFTRLSPPSPSPIRAPPPAPMSSSRVSPSPVPASRFSGAPSPVPSRFSPTPPPSAPIPTRAPPAPVSRVPPAPAPAPAPGSRVPPAPAPAPAPGRPSEADLAALYSSANSGFDDAVQPNLGFGSSVTPAPVAPRPPPPAPVAASRPSPPPAPAPAAPNNASPPKSANDLAAFYMSANTEGGSTDSSVQQSSSEFDLALQFMKMNSGFDDPVQPNT